MEEKTRAMSFKVKTSNGVAEPIQNLNGLSTISAVICDYFVTCDMTFVTAISHLEDSELKWRW